MNEHWVLSAAHCFEGEKLPDAIRVTAGIIDRRDFGNFTHVYEVFLHHLWGGLDTFRYDVALLKVRITRSIMRSGIF